MSSKKISIDLPEDLLSEIDEESEKKVRSRSGQIIFILRQYYESKGEKKNE